MKARIRLRRATLRELDVLVRQRRDMWSDMGVKDQEQLNKQDRVFRSWARSRLKAGTLMAWVAETHKGTIVAGGTMWLRPSVLRPGTEHLAQPFLLSMYTEPKWRERRLASKIVDKAVEWAKENGYTEIMLHASRMGKGIYLHRGFKRTWEMKRELARKPSRQCL
jgi:GNAT superfamily N-acetyltransferase